MTLNESITSNGLNVSDKEERTQKLELKLRLNLPEEISVDYIADDIALNNVKEVNDLELRRTDGLLPFVLTILEELGAPIPSAGEVQLAFLKYGRSVYPGCASPRSASPVYIPPNIPAEQLPAYFPTLQRLKELPVEYFRRPVGMLNAEIGDIVQFSLLRIVDKKTADDLTETEQKTTQQQETEQAKNIRVFVRCHYDLKQRRNLA